VILCDLHKESYVKTWLSFVCFASVQHQGGGAAPLAKEVKAEEGASPANKEASAPVPTASKHPAPETITSAAATVSGGAEKKVVLNRTTELWFADQRRRIEASTMGLHVDQCERHRHCTRGYKHGGRGGHCALPAGVTPDGTRPTVISAKRARYLRLLEINAGGGEVTPPTAEEEEAHQLARERRRASGKTVRFAPTPPPRSPPSTPNWSEDGEEEDETPWAAHSFMSTAMLEKSERDKRRFAEIDRACIIPVPHPSMRPLRSSMPQRDFDPFFRLPPLALAGAAPEPPKVPTTAPKVPTTTPKAHRPSPSASTLNGHGGGGSSGGTKRSPAVAASSRGRSSSSSSSSSGGSSGGGGGGGGGGRRNTDVPLRADGSLEPCERDSNCVRGFRHCGWGGRCSYAPCRAPALPAAPPAGVPAGKRKRRVERSVGGAPSRAPASSRGAPKTAPALDQCERNPLCTRGYKHKGWGGHCLLVPAGQRPVAAAAAAAADADDEGDEDEDKEAEEAEEAVEEEVEEEEEEEEDDEDDEEEGEGEDEDEEKEEEEEEEEEADGGEGDGEEGAMEGACDDEEGAAAAEEEEYEVEDGVEDEMAQDEGHDSSSHGTSTLGGKFDEPAAPAGLEEAHARRQGVPGWPSTE